MKTLLKKVQELEQEADTVARRAKEQGQKALQAVVTQEERVLAEMQVSAQAKADAIVAQHVAQVKDELNRLQQETDQTVTTIHQAAEANRPAALTLAHDLFKKLYR